MAADPGPELRGQVALITGASRGAGRRIALELAARGMAVALTARSVDALDEVASEVEDAGGHALVAPGDLTDRLSVESIVSRVEGGLGPIDLLVNQAQSGGIGEFVAADPDDWWNSVELNLRGTALSCHATLKRMLPRRRGRIVNIASDLAAAPAPAATASACSQAAVLRLTDSLAAGCRPHGILVFALGASMSAAGSVEGDGDAASFAGTPVSALISDRGLGPLVAAVAAGRADRLTGRYIHVDQDLMELIGLAADIERDDLQQLRMRRLVSSAWRPPARLAEAREGH